MTKSSQQFVTPLSVSAIAGSKVYTELFDLTAEAEMGHIELSRSADIILVAPRQLISYQKWHKDL